MQALLILLLAASSVVALHSDNNRLIRTATRLNTVEHNVNETISPGARLQAPRQETDPQWHLLFADLSQTDPRLPLNGWQRLFFCYYHLRAALALDPDSADAKTRMAETTYRLGWYAEAERLYTELFQVYPALVFRLAEIHRLQGRASETTPLYERAIERYDELIEQYPTHAGLWQRKSKCYLELQRFDEIEKILNDARGRTTDPEFKETLAALLADMYGFWALSLNTENESEEITRRRLRLIAAGLKQKPDNDTLLVQLTMIGLADTPLAEIARKGYDPRRHAEDAPAAVLKVIGTHELLYGDPAQGIKFLELGAVKNPEDAEILNNLAFALIPTDAARALALANRALQRRPNNANYLDTRGHAYLKLEQYQNALADLERALAGIGGSHELYQALADCCVKLQLDAKAASYQQQADQLRR